MESYSRRPLYVLLGRMPGTILTRPYKGLLVQVQVLTEGFAYAGRIYPWLSALAKAITGSHTNGFLFFRNTLNHNKETALLE